MHSHHNIALFYDSHFSSTETFGVPDLLLMACDTLKINTLSQEQLSVFLQDNGAGSILFMGHCQHSPVKFKQLFVEYFLRGGDIVWLGGQPFDIELLIANNPWDQQDPVSIYNLGVSPWYVEPRSEIDRSESELSIVPELRNCFDGLDNFIVSRQICQIMPDGWGRRVVLGKINKGASAPLHTELFSMVESGRTWNINGSRMICCGVKPGEDWDLSKTTRLISGIITFLAEDQRNKLKIGSSLNNVAVSQGKDIELEIAPRNNFEISKLSACILDAADNEIETIVLDSKLTHISTSHLKQGRYQIKIIDEHQDLACNEWFAVIETSVDKKSSGKIGISMQNGYSGINMDGRILPLQTYCGYASARTIATIIPGFAKADIHIHHVGIAMKWGCRESGEFNWSVFDEIFERVLREDPQSLLFPRIRLTEPDWFREANPDSFCQHETGLDCGEKATEIPAFMSFFDRKWIDYTINAMNSLVAHLKNSWYGDRFVGVFYSYGSTGEWGEECQDGVFWADHHPDFLQHFRSFLKKKYGSDANLKSAWSRIDNLNPKDMVIPDNRRFRESNNRTHLLENPELWYKQARLTGPISIEKAEIPNFFRRYIGHYGMFRDPDKIRDVMDFLDCYIHAFTLLQQELSDSFKKAGNRKILIATFNGYSFGGACDIDGAHTQDGYPEFLDETDNLDILATASFYTRSENPTGDQICRSLCESYHLRNKLYLQENDQRTCLANVGSQNINLGVVSGTMEESIYTMKRNWIARVCHGSGLWWFDFSKGYYDHPELIKILGDLQSIYQRLIKQANHKAFDQELTKCSMLYSVHSHLYQAGANSNFSKRVGEDLPQRYFSRYGIPWESYFLEDINKAPVNKVNLFMNTFHIDSKKREIIEDRYKRNGNVLIWLYAPGIFDENGFSIDKVSELTGFEMKFDFEQRKQRIEITNFEHPIGNALFCENLEEFGSVAADDPYMGPSRDKISPQIYVSDNDSEAISIGKQEGTQNIAFAVKKFKNWTSVYISAPILPACVMRAILNWLNIETIIDGLDNLYTNGDIIGLNSLNSEYKTIRLPGEFEIEDMLTGRSYQSKNCKTKIWVPYSDTFIGRLYKH